MSGKKTVAQKNSPSLIKKHYHWVIAGIAFLIMFISIGAQNTKNSLFLIPITESLGISRTQFSLAGTLSSIMAILSSVVFGKILPHHGYRYPVMTMMLVSAGAYGLFSATTNYATLLMAFALLGTTAGFCGSAGITWLISRWFQKHRGTILGAVLAASGIGGSVLSIVQSALIEGVSYRAAYLFVSVSLLVLAAAIFLLVRNHPKDMGLTPFGSETKIVSIKEPRNLSFQGYSYPILKKKPVFILLFIFTALSSIVAYLCTTALVPHLVDVGIPSTQAASLQSLYLLLLTAGKVLSGFLCDKINPRRTTFICMVATVGALVLLLLTKTVSFAVWVCVTCALALPIVSVTIPLFASSLFGYHAQTHYIALLMTMPTAATMLSNLLASSIHDIFHSYAPAYYIGLTLSVVLFFMFFFLCASANKLQRQWEAENES